MGAGGAKNRAESRLQQGADCACSPRLQLTGSQAGSAALSRPPPDTSGQLHNALRTADSGLNQGMTKPSPPPLLGPQRRRAFCCSLRRDGIEGWRRVSVENNSRQWDVPEKQRLASQAVPPSWFLLPGLEMQN